jgi:50S ribosomal protein L16 3-hydroxylase
MLRLPDGLDTASFLKHYWQRRPLLMRNALQVPDAVSANELAFLACDEEVESRIVMEHGVSGPWQVLHGPFADDDFAQLPGSHWTLLVQDVDKLLPEVASVLDDFRFLPDWRVDDIMVSYAADQGSVGPHTDDYDVFLIQASGRRRWQINSEPVADAELLPGLDLRILKHFEPDEDWVLDPGDVLYLPPKIAHWGTGLDECMTWSVGFRAPSAGEIAAAWVEHRLATTSDERYRDPSPGRITHPGEIPPQTFDATRRMCAQWLDPEPADFTRWVTGFLSEPKEHLSPMPPATPLSGPDLARRLRAGASLRRAPGARILYSRQDEVLHLGASGIVHDLHAGLADLATLLADRRYVQADRLLPWLDDLQALDLLVTLYNGGQLELEDGKG